MANLYITEFNELGEDGSGNNLPAAAMPPAAQQKVAYTTSTASAAFNQRTGLIRVTADANAHLKFGASPTADATDMLVLANTVEYFGVKPGQKVAVYDGSS